MATNTEKIVVKVVVQGQGDLKNLTNTTGKATKGVGGLVKKYGLLTLGVGAAIKAFKAINSAISTSIKTFRDFEFQMAKVRAITGASNKEFAMLSKSAEDLGRTTFFTATQVGELQTNYGKLGFTTKEILKAQEATLQLATATGTDLGRAATVAGAAVRGFGLDASETQRVVDVMAVSFTSSAMDIEKWQTGMTKVAPIAKSAGFSIEDTAAIMAKLADSGIEASIAGTSLRNILLKMQDPSSDLTKAFGGTIHSLDELIPAMKKFSDEGGDLAKIMEVVDLRQAAAFEQMITSADATLELRDALLKAKGAAAAMSEIVGDTLEGAFKRFNSALQGLMINLSESVIGKTLQNVIDGFSDMINVISDFVDIPISENLEKQRFELNILVDRLTDVNIQEEERNRLIGEINIKYPDFLKNINTETASTKDLRDRLRETNVNLKNKILLQREVEKTQKAQTKAEKATNLEIDKEEKFLSRLLIITEKYNIELKDGLSFQERFSVVIKNLQDRFNGLGKWLDPALNQAIKLNDTFKGLSNAQKLTVKSTEELTIANKALLDLEKELGLFKEDIEPDDDKNLKIKKSKINLYAEEKALLEKKLREDLNLEKEALIDGNIDQELFDLIKFELQQSHFQKMLDLNLQYSEDTSAITGKMLDGELLRIKTIAEAEAKKNAASKKDRDDQIKSVDQLGKTLITMAGDEKKLQGLKKIGIKITAAATLATNLETIANAKLAISKAATEPFPASLIAIVSVLAAMLGAAQSAKTITTFADGGMVHGNSHANGGEKFAVGGRVVELEGGEAVINKRSTSMFKNQLSAMNSAGGGVKFADGGLTNLPSFAQSQFNATSQAGMMGAIGQGSRVVVVESDISTVQNTVSVIEAEATI